MNRHSRMLVVGWGRQQIAIQRELQTWFIRYLYFPTLVIRESRIGGSGWRTSAVQLLNRTLHTASDSKSVTAAPSPDTVRLAGPLRNKTPHSPVRRSRICSSVRGQAQSCRWKGWSIGTPSHDPRIAKVRYLYSLCRVACSRSGGDAVWSGRVGRARKNSERAAEL